MKVKCAPTLVSMPFRGAVGPSKARIRRAGRRAFHMLVPLLATALALAQSTSVPDASREELPFNRRLAELADGVALDAGSGSGSGTDEANSYPGSVDYPPPGTPALPPLPPPALPPPLGCTLDFSKADWRGNSGGHISGADGNLPMEFTTMEQL